MKLLRKAVGCAGQCVRLLPLLFVCALLLWCYYAYVVVLIVNIIDSAYVAVRQRACLIGNRCCGALPVLPSVFSDRIYDFSSVL
jgi:hypothetical protein